MLVLSDIIVQISWGVLAFAIILVSLSRAPIGAVHLLLRLSTLIFSIELLDHFYVVILILTYVMASVRQVIVLLLWLLVKLDWHRALTLRQTCIVHSCLLSLEAKLFKYRNGIRCILRIVAAVDHLRRKQLDNFWIRHLVIVVGINLLQKQIYLLLIQIELHCVNQGSELQLIQKTDPLLVDRLEKITEIVQELFVLFQLEV